ncbi:MAG: RluA family pseudouridine synthase [Clostridia bacterium]|nr:RluA family pseudouridine synthase [Clostridia bacterium]
MQELTYLITSAEEGVLLRKVALATLRMSQTQFKRAKFQGALLLDGRSAHADERVHAGQRLVIRLPKKKGPPLEPYSLSLSIPYQDEGLLVIDKPAPLPSVSSRQRGFTLENALFSHLGCPENFVYHPVNRLDKGTSGLMAVALTPHVQQRLQAALHTEGFLREYLAVCEGSPREKEGVIRQPIAKADGASIRRRVTAGGKAAATHYRVLRQTHERSLLSLLLETGRTHQIRVHLAWLDCPVVGDFLYGQEDGSIPGRFALHSHRLAFSSPVTGEPVRSESPLPKELERLLVSAPRLCYH